MMRRALNDRCSSFSEWLRQHVALASLIVLICSLAPRLVFTALSDPKDLLFPDSYTYLPPATSLVTDGAFLDKDRRPEVSRTPGYPTFLAGVMVMVGRDWSGADLSKILYAQTIITSWYVVFLYWLARRTLPPVTAFTAATLAAFSPWGAALAGRGLTEGLFLFVLTLLFLTMKLVQEADRVATAAWMSALVGLLTAVGVLIRPIWPLVWLVGVGLFIQYGPRRKGAWLVLTVMLVTAATPLWLWTLRNVHQADVHRLTDHASRAAWQYLASRVESTVTGEDRFNLIAAKMLEEASWNLSVHDADQERWKRAQETFQQYPFLTLYSFGLSTLEHIVHPSPDILIPPKLNFPGDYGVLAAVWAVGLLLAHLGWRCKSSPQWDRGFIDRGWILTVFLICLALTLTTGIAFGAGSRFRAPLELPIMLLAAVGLIDVLVRCAGLSQAKEHIEPGPAHLASPLVPFKE